MPTTYCNIRPGGAQQHQQELRVYSRQIRPREVESTMVFQPCQESDPRVLPEVNHLNLPIAVRKGTRSCTQYPISNYVCYNHLSPSFQAFISRLAKTETPKNIYEALNKLEWKKGVLEEMVALEKNHTWDVVNNPEGKTPIGCKWVFAIKYKSDGSIDRYKARLVAKGFTLTYGIEYQKTFAPVAKLNIVRVLLSIAANLDWQLQQLDIKNAFPNGDLEEEVYMDLPPGFDKERKEGKVYKLKKSLYKLKQSPQA